MNRFSHLAFKNIWVKKARSLIIFFTIALGVAMIVATSISNNGVDTIMRRQIERYIGEDHLIVAPLSETSFISMSVVERVEKIEGVKKVRPWLPFVTARDKTNEKRRFIMIARDTTGLKSLTKGRRLRPRETGAALLSRNFAKRNKIKVGSLIDLKVKSIESEGKDEPVYRDRRLKIVGLYKVPPRMDRKEGWLYVTRAGIMEIDPPVAERVFNVLVQVDASSTVGETQDRIKKALGEGLRVVDAEDYARAAVFDPYIGLMKTILKFFSFIALLISGHIISSIFFISIKERIRDFGLLRSIGATRGQIMKVLVLEAAAFGLISSVLGVFLGLGVAKLMMAVTARAFFFGYEAPIPYAVPWQGVVMGVSAGIIVTVCATLYPSFRASRSSPVESIRGNVALRITRRRAVDVTIGLALLAASAPLMYLNFGGRQPFPFVCTGIVLAFVGMFFLVIHLLPLVSAALGRLFESAFGREGFLSQKNIEWNLDRSALTVSVVISLIAAIIMVGGAEVAGHKSTDLLMEKFMGGDLLINPAGGLNVKETTAIREMEEVEDLVYMGHEEASINGKRFDFYLIEPGEYFRLSSFIFKEGNEKTARRMLSEGNAVILSAQSSKEHNRGLGDTVKIDTKRGEVDFRVAGVVYFYNDILSWRDGARYFDRNKAYMLMIKVKDESRADEINRKIKARLKDIGHEVYYSATLEQKKAWFRRQNAHIANVFKASLLIVVFVVGMAVFNTMYLNSMERTREIGVMRALGVTRGQVRKIILLEGLTICLVAAVIGTVFSIYEITGIYRSLEYFVGFRTPFVFPLVPAAIAIGISLVISITGSIYPAHRSASRDITTSLRYE